LAPIAFPATPHFTIFGFDAANSRAYNLRPEDGTLRPYPVAGGISNVSPLATISRRITLPNGVPLTASSVLGVFTIAQGQFLGGIAVHSGEARVLTPIRGRVDVAGLAVLKDGHIIALEHDGSLVRIEAETGRLSMLGELRRQIEVAGFDKVAGKFVALSGTELIAVDIARAAAVTIANVPSLADVDACGLASLGRRVVVADRKTSTLLAFNLRYEPAGTIGPSPLGAGVCGIVAVPR
jgi:hypothetical protein